MTPAEWTPLNKAPMPYKMVVLRCSLDGLEYFGLTYCSYRSAFIEPITGQTALPILGPCDGWRYDDRATQ